MKVSGLDMKNAFADYKDFLVVTIVILYFFSLHYLGKFFYKKHKENAFKDYTEEWKNLKR